MAWVGLGNLTVVLRSQFVAPRVVLGIISTSALELIYNTVYGLWVTMKYV